MKPVTVRILDFNNLKLKKELDIYTSLIFTRQWSGVGEFELHAPLNRAGGIIKNDIIMLDNDGRRCGIVRGVKWDEISQNVIITGQTLNGLTMQRIIPGTNSTENHGYDNIPPYPLVETQSLPVETILKHYVTNATSGAGRNIPQLTIARDLERGESGKWMARFVPLDEELSKICDYYNCGYEIRLEKGGFVFDILPGRDLSRTVKFSQDFENLQELTSETGTIGYKNVAYAGGRGDGENRAVQAVTLEDKNPTGIDRFETFIDCGDLDIFETAEQMSIEAQAKQELKQYKEEFNITGKALQFGPFRYLTDYNLGDLVSVKTRRFGGVPVRITEITEVYERGNTSVNVTFGQPKDDIIAAIKRQTRRTVR